MSSLFLDRGASRAKRKCFLLVDRLGVACARSVANVLAASGFRYCCRKRAVLRHVLWLCWASSSGKLDCVEMFVKFAKFSSLKELSCHPLWAMKCLADRCVMIFAEQYGHSASMNEPTAHNRVFNMVVLMGAGCRLGLFFHVHFDKILKRLRQLSNFAINLGKRLWLRKRVYFVSFVTRAQKCRRGSRLENARAPQHVVVCTERKTEGKRGGERERERDLWDKLVRLSDICKAKIDAKRHREEVGYCV